MEIHYILDVPMSPIMANGSSSGVQMLGQLLSLFFVFVLIIFAAYFTAKFVGKKGAIIASNKNIRMIEKMSLSIDKSLYIISVGETYYLIGVTKNKIELIDRIDKEQIYLTPQEIEANQFLRPFNDYLNKFMHNDKGPNGMTDEKKMDSVAKHDLLEKLEKIKVRNTTISQLKDKDEEYEDETKHSKF